MRVLIVEDNLETAESYSHYLKLLGYETLVANSILEAKNLVGSNDFDVGIVDWWLRGGEQGLDILKWLRENGHNQPICIVSGAAMSHCDEISTKIESYARVIAVQKPADAEKIIEKLRLMI